MRHPVACALVAGWFLLVFGAAVSAQDAGAAAPDAVAPAVAASITAAPIALAPALAPSIRTPSAPDAWGGPRDASHGTLSDRVVAYRIDARLDETTHAIEGRQTLAWRNRADRPIDRIYLHLYLNAFQNPGSTLLTERAVDFARGNARGSGGALEDGEWGHIDLKRVEQDGAAATWRFVQPDGGPATDQTVVEVDLPRAVGAGETLVLEIDFLSQLPRVLLRTGWFGDFHLAGQWFPKIAVLELPGERGATEPRWNAHEFHFHSEFYADYGSFDVRINVPKNYTVGAVGELQGEPEADGDRLTWRYTQDDVIDFAFVAAPDYKTLETTWTGPGSPEVAVRVIYPPEYEASAAPVLKATTDSLDYFSRTLGAYPYRTVTAVVPPYNAQEAGGMEYPTFFTASGFNKVDPQGPIQFALDFVTVHEFGHGYFMGIIGSNEFEEPWLDEGLNEFWDQRMLSARGQNLELGSPFLRWLGIAARVSPWVFERASGVVGMQDPAEPLDADSWNRFSNSTYGSIYARTAIMFRDMEREIGSEALKRGFKGYYERWKFRHPSSADLEAALAEFTGHSDVVRRYFAEQVYGTRKIDDKVDRITSVEVLPQPGSFVVDGKRGERSASDVTKEIAATRKAWKAKNPDAKPGTGPWPWRTVVTLRRHGAAVPQEVKIHFADGTSERFDWNDDRKWKRIVIERPVRAVAAEIDPEQKIYLDIDKLDDSLTIDPDRSASRRWSADLAAIAGAFFSFLVTL